MNAPKPKPKAISAREITAAVVRTWFPPRRWAVCPNSSWGLNLPWESDVIAVSSSNVVHEVEVKISVSDFRRELKKERWRMWPIDKVPQIDCYWFAVPLAIAETVMAEAPAAAGVFVVLPSGKVERRRCSARPRGRKRERDLRTKVWRLAALRYWSQEFKPKPGV